MCHTGLVKPLDGLRHVWQALNMVEKRSLLELIVGSIEYDFREDDDSVQGTWDVRLNGEDLTIEYLPFYRSEILPTRQPVSGTASSA